ncbi:hypothetical protein JEZ13_07550 [bacterium]|nr:hypothetical protein [bacterium]
MKKYLLSSLLIIMISLIGAQAYFFDMRLGDFGCITRVVFEFTGKVDYNIHSNEKELKIDFSSLKEGDIQLPVEKSNNIELIKINKENGVSQVKFDFVYALEYASYSYYEKNKHLLIVLDVYDKEYLDNKEKGLATILFKAQKFPLSKSESELFAFSNRYPTDPLVNFYLGRLYAVQKNKTMAVSYLEKIESGSVFYLDAQAYIANLKNNKYPQGEIKPDFLDSIKTEESSEIIQKTTIPTPVNDLKEENQVEANKVEVVNESGSKNIDHDKDDIPVQTSSKTNPIWLMIVGISFLIIIVQFVRNIKRNILIKELNAKLENTNFELRALANKLEKGVIENSKTKDRIIIKLYNNGWKANDIANELNTSLEIVEATISKEGRL